jgi:hypothetical protein
MATTTYKILGQSAPAATTETALYTVPAATETIISSVTVCNRGSSAATYRIYVANNGAATANAQYLVFDSTLAPKAVVALTLGITLDATDVLRVYASTADLSFNAFGSELS